MARDDWRIAGDVARARDEARRDANAERPAREDPLDELAPDERASVRRARARAKQAAERKRPS